MENRDLIVFPIDKNERSSVKWERTDEYDIMKIDTKLRGGDNMHQETYSKNEIDLKFENLSDRMDNKFELLSQKVDNGFSNQVLQINNSFLEFKQALKDESEKERKERQNEKKELIKWSIGTAVAIIAAVAALLALT
ncbi:hypothetical protein [Lactococcus cremoris]|uniref:hypothetical protein n=1 Tax=Lactococcus lactis subsp. cremoris TaxID=1359 RepID=UPI0021824314|nr:hypothetical protein [Lactococcus cremoris]MCT0501987.1 hypothetical protein [Lactococcus cremoris]